MLSVQDGQDRILTQIARSTPPEFLPLGRSLGRVVAEDVRAPFDVPPTDNSAVDGYAVTSADIPATGTRDLAVVADLPAGSVFDGALGPGQAVRISTGDEVVEPGSARKPGQIYDANRFALSGSIEQCGGEVVDLGIVPDVRDELRARLLDAGAAGDVVVTSGGVSVGAYDLVKDVLDEIGALEFWQVAMQTGPPLAVGRIGSAHFFGLPGNPVASMLAFMLFVRPAIFKLAGRRRLFPEVYAARATEAMRKKKGRREFKRGVLQFSDGCWEVRTTGPQGSGILSSMVAGNCLIVPEEGRGDVASGETVLVEPF